MNKITWLMLIAACLPFVATICAKAMGKGFDNSNPRPWLAGLEGWRGRANAAQANLFEGLPFFYAAVLFALYKQADIALITNLMLAWVVIRIAFVATYIAGYGAVRSLLWFSALVVNIVILFA
ncbi:MAG: MAPEG family protein [Burkholderiaceae bacterium]|nr:MAPEG family protein [Burkholderiaceae bacterium]